MEDGFVSDVLLQTPSYGRTSVARLARTYLHQLCADIECSLENLSGAMGDRDEWNPC